MTLLISSQRLDVEVSLQVLMRFVKLITHLKLIKLTFLSRVAHCQY